MFFVFRKYREYLILNRNVLISFAVSLSMAALAAQLFSDQPSYINTTVTLLVDYAAYFSTFGALFYLGNKRRYKVDGHTDVATLRRDLIKITFSLGIAELVYTVIRWLFHYYILQLNYEPYMASVLAQVIAAAVYMIVINLSVKMTKLYNDDS